MATESPVTDNSAQDNSADNKKSDSKAPSKSYEVSKSPATKSADSNSLVYALLGVVAIGAVLGFGYMRRGKK